MGSIQVFTQNTVSNLLTYGERLSIPYVTFHDMQRVLNVHFILSLEGQRACTSSGVSVGYHLFVVDDSVHLCMRYTPRRRGATVDVEPPDENH